MINVNFLPFVGREYGKGGIFGKKILILGESHHCNPGEATKDINANVVLTTPANKGITMKLNANTYNADNVFVTYYVSLQTSLGRAFVASLGEPEGDEGNTEDG